MVRAPTNQPAISPSRATFERFFLLKQRINDKDRKNQHANLLEAASNGSRRRRDPNKNMLQQLQLQMQGQHEYFYNITRVDMESQFWQRVLLFSGEGGSFVQPHPIEVLYMGGYRGSSFNQRIGRFRTLGDQFVFHDVRDIPDRPTAMEIARVGHLAFWDNREECLVLFAG